MTSRKHVAGGLCRNINPSNGTYEWFNYTYYASFCALEYGQCAPDQEFLSTRQVFKQYTRSSCPFRLGAESVYIGRCDDSCAVDEASCGNGNYTLMMDIPVEDGGTGIPLDPTCQVVQTVYGNCDGRCVWSADTCEAGETYHPPSYLDDTICTCDKVQVGGCKFPGNPVDCAVSPDSCDESQKWLTPQEVVDQENWACFLCRTPPPPTTSPTVSPTSVIAPSISSTNLPISNSINELYLSLAIGCSVGLVIFLLLIISIMRNKEEIKMKQKNDIMTKPPSIITTSKTLEGNGNHNHDQEDDGHVDDDRDCIDDENLSFENDDDISGISSCVKEDHESTSGKRKMCIIS